MAPDHVHLIRHAQGYHNLSLANHSIRDPLLTPEGERQCIELSKRIENIQSIDCIVASPIRRALYTALNTFRDVLQANSNLRIIALAELQETASIPCDVGLSLDELRQEFAGMPIDFSLVPEDWNNKRSGPFAPRADLVAQRARIARQFLRSRPEKEVAVVAHGGFLHFLTEDWSGSTTGCGTGWSNCELRTYTFDQSKDNTANNASLIETDSSLARRKYTSKPPTSDEQLELQLVAQHAWAADGYIVLPDSSTTKDTASRGDVYRETEV